MTNNLENIQAVSQIRDLMYSPVGFLINPLKYTVYGVYLGGF